MPKIIRVSARAVTDSSECSKRLPKPHHDSAGRSIMTVPPDGQATGMSSVPCDHSKRSGSGRPSVTYLSAVTARTADGIESRAVRIMRIICRSVRC